ncbi:hypothetical protein C8Q80DRAFT_207019 [Daedaleopsis nitida]|nr:hypothetical protein C8Q80DRAFT_207019 [Daedaleopsis nitida]
MKTNRCSHLPKTALDILRDHFENVSPNPSSAVQSDLSEQIKRAVPECHDLTSVQVSRIFARMRLRDKKDTMKAMLGPHRPKAAQNPNWKRGTRVVHKLNVLLDETPTPTLEVAQIWARALAGTMTAEDVISYAASRSRTQRPEPGSGSSVVRRSRRPSPQAASVTVGIDAPALAASLHAALSECESRDPLLRRPRSDATGSVDGGSASPRPKTFADLARWVSEHNTGKPAPEV